MLANILMLRRWIQTDGHLVLEGDESAIELREALTYLRTHTHQECQRHGIGIPTAYLIPDPSVLEPKRRGRKPRNMLDLELPQPKPLPYNPHGGTPDVWFR